METTDIFKAAFLMVRAHRVTVVNGTPSRFVFAPDAEKDAREYETATVSVATYADTLARLRRLVAERRAGAVR